MRKGERRCKEVKRIRKEAREAQRRSNDLAKVHRKLQRMLQEERRYEELRGAP